MHVAILGSTGSLGSHVCVELLRRGHEVSGVSRSPDGLGQHERYHTIPLDISIATTGDFLEAFEGTEAIVWGYHPHPSPSVYRSYLETTRRVVLAAKAVSKATPVPYLIMVGGTGSLELPGRPLETVLDHREWWLALQRYLADSEAATAEMIERLQLTGSQMAKDRWAYRNARLSMKAGNATDAQYEIIEKNEQQILTSDNSIPDVPLAARATLMMFEGNTGFKWTFLSPPVGYRRAAATGKYEVWFDELPMRPSAEGNPGSQTADGAEDHLLGISVPDLALAIVDEVESQEKVGRHWTAVGELDSTAAFERYARINQI